MVRQKTIFGRDTAKVWATGGAPHGRNRRAGNLFFNGPVIYSYGSHFSVGVKLETGDFLLNADTYSVTTSRHQSEVRYAVDMQIRATNRQRILIPFSALQSARINPYKVEVVAVETDRQLEERCRSLHCRQVNDPPHTHPRHLMGRSVFRVQVGQAGDIPVDRYFISGLDETARDVWRGFFLSELPGPVSTVAEALESLKPDMVRAYEAVEAGEFYLGRAPGPPVLRQGEWFFIPEPLVKTRTLEKVYFPNLTTPTGDPVPSLLLPVGPGAFGRQSHMVKEQRSGPSGLLYVRGQVKHSRKEHKTLMLRGWHSAYMNTALGSWSAGGRID